MSFEKKMSNILESINIIKELLKYLPDSVDYKNDQVWNELTDDEQDSVEKVRKIANDFLNGLKMINIPREKALNTLQYFKEYIYNNGYYFANCETSAANHNCHYLERGCTGCIKNT